MLHNHEHFTDENDIVTAIVSLSSWLLSHFLSFSLKTGYHFMKKYDDDEYILMIGVSYSQTLFILFRSSFLWFPISVKYYVIFIIKTTIKIYSFFGSFRKKENIFSFFFHSHIFRLVTHSYTHTHTYIGKDKWAFEIR